MSSTTGSTEVYFESSELEADYEEYLEIVRITIPEITQYLN